MGGTRLSLEHAVASLTICAVLRRAAKVHACRLVAADLHAVEVLAAGFFLEGLEEEALHVHQ